MDNWKFCFVMCTDDKQYAEEAVYYIKELKVPEGYTVEIQLVEGASGMAAGYNQAMRSSDAKYKIYLHQDVMIVESRFLEYILKIFEDDKVGMIGMAGAPKLPENGVMWYTPCVGSIYVGEPGKIWRNDIGTVNGAYQMVEMIDGLLMTTQYDVTWREDIFKGWDFYDASQSQEFIRRGYKVVVPGMEKPWCIHDCGNTDLENYWTERKRFLKEYKN